MFIIIAALGFINNTGQGLVVFVSIFATLFVLGAIFWATGQLRERKLARLQSEGKVYDADSIDYAPVHLLNLLLTRDYTVFQAYFNYTDHKGVSYATKTRWYSVRLGRNDTYFTPLDDFKFTAKIYVNPNNSRDYAVDLYAEER